MLLFLIPVVAAVAVAVALASEGGGRRGKDSRDDGQVFYTVSRRK